MRNREEIRCRLDPKDIDMLSRIFEGCDGIGIVSTLDQKAGLVVIRLTPDTYSEVLEVLENLPFRVEVLEE